MDLQINEQLIQKYSVAGPRYTSYPTAPMWKEVSRDIQKKWYKDVAVTGTRPLSLYIHIPFCLERCFYCGCNVIITDQQKTAKTYVDYLLQELDGLAEFFQGKTLVQLHFGGGTPTFLQDEEFIKILAKIRSLFHFDENIEIAIEVDPRKTRLTQLEFLKEQGFNRLSLGVQDFNPQVQSAINRIQSEEITFRHLEKARELKFRGINFDLIYGLPHQNTESFQQTLNSVIQMNPDRLAVYNFAYLPEKFPYHRRIEESALPDSQTKMAILLNTIQSFCDANYEYIGMDHFATQKDELTKAMKDRSLYRNFMGYTTIDNMDMLGVGVSSIGEFNNHYLQNEKKLSRYQKAIEEDGYASMVGCTFSEDDQIRKWIILRLICHFYLSFQEFQEAFGLNFMENFTEELQALEGMEKDGLLSVSSEGIQVHDTGKILIRNICMAFDSYLKRKDVPQVKYSKTI